jgi:hypothetical protein
LAICQALVAMFVLVMLIRLVIRIPDMDGIDGQGRLDRRRRLAVSRDI